MPPDNQPAADVVTGLDYFSAMPKEVLEQFLADCSDEELFAHRRIYKKLGPTIQSIFIKRGSPKALIRILIEKELYSSFSINPQQFYKSLSSTQHQVADTSALRLLTALEAIEKLNHWYFWQSKVLNALLVAKNYNAIAAWFKLIITPDATVKNLTTFLTEYIPSENDFQNINPLDFIHEYQSRFTTYEKFKFFQKVAPKLPLEEAKQLAKYILRLQFPEQNFRLSISEIQATSQLLKFVQDTRVLANHAIDPEKLQLLQLRFSTVEMITEANEAETFAASIRNNDIFRELAFKPEQPPINAYMKWIILGADLEMLNSTVVPRQRFTPLSWAAFKGHFQCAQALIVAGANLEVKNILYDCTPLHEAADRGHTEMLRLLLEAGADITAKAKNGFTAILWAAQNGHTESVQLLADAGADINETTSVQLLTNLDEQQHGPTQQQNVTALSLAIDSGHLRTVKRLLALGAKCKARLDGGVMLSKWKHTAKIKTHYVPMLFALLEAGIGCVNIEAYTKDDPIKKILNLVEQFDSEPIFEIAWITLITTPSEAFGNSTIDHYLVFLLLAKRLIKRFPNEFSFIPNIDACLNVGEVCDAVERALIDPYVYEHLKTPKIMPMVAFRAALNVFPFSVTQKMAARFFLAGSDHVNTLRTIKNEDELLCFVLQVRFFELYPEHFNYAFPAVHKPSGVSTALVHYLHFNEVLLIDDVIEILLAGNKPEQVEQYWQQAPVFALQFVASEGMTDIARLLLAAGAFPDQEDPDGFTPLMHACNTPQIVEMLCAAHADLNHRSSRGLTPLMYFTQKGAEQAAAVLIQAGATVDCINQATGLTAFMMAAEMEKPEMLHLLLANGADINATDPTGQTALMRAIKAGKKKSIEFLLTYGADLTRTDRQALSALTMATSSGDFTLMRRILMAKGISLADLNKSLLIAIEKQDFFMVCALLEAGAEPFAQTEVPDIALLLSTIRSFEACDNNAALKSLFKNNIQQFKNKQHRYLAMYLFCNKLAKKSTEFSQVLAAGAVFLSFDEMAQRLEGFLDNCLYFLPQLDPLSAQPISEFKKVVKYYPFVQLKAMAIRFIPNEPAYLAEYEAVESTDALLAAVSHGRLKTLFPDQIILIEAEETALDAETDEDHNTKTQKNALIDYIADRDVEHDITQVIQLIADGAIYDQAISVVVNNCEYSKNALKYSVMYGHSAIFELLVNLGVDLDIRDDEMRSPLFTAVRFQRYDMMDRLIELGADLTVLDLNSCTPLEYAVREGDLIAARKLLLKVGSNIKLDNLFFMAVKNKNLEMIQLLFDFGANVHVILGNKNPIKIAALNGDSQVVKWLLEHGANIEGTLGTATPLISIIEELGTKVNSRVMAMKLIEVIKLLIASGANLNAKDTQGQTVLVLTIAKLYDVIIGRTSQYDYWAAQSIILPKPTIDLPNAIALPEKIGIFFDVVKLLIEADADLELINGNNETALMAVIRQPFYYKKDDLIALLLENGAKLEFPNRKSALSCSIKSQNDNHQIESIRITTEIDSATDVDAALAIWCSASDLDDFLFYRRSVLIRIMKKFYKGEELLERLAEIEAITFDDYLIQRFSNPIRFNPLAHVIENEEYPLARIYRESMWQGVYDTYEALLGQQGKAEAPNHLGILDFLIIPFVAKWLMSVSQNHRIHVFFRVSIKLVAFPLYMLSAALAALLTLPLIPVVALVHAATYLKANQLVQEINDSDVEVGVELPKLTPMQIRGIKIRKYETDKAECIPPSRLHAFQALNVGGGYEPLSTSTKFRIS